MKIKFGFYNHWTEDNYTRDNLVVLGFDWYKSAGSSWVTITLFNFEFEVMI